VVVVLVKTSQLMMYKEMAALFLRCLQNLWAERRIFDAEDGVTCNNLWVLKGFNAPCFSTLLLMVRDPMYAFRCSFISFNTWIGSNEVVEPALYVWFMRCALRTLPNILAVLLTFVAIWSLLVRLLSSYSNFL